MLSRCATHILLLMLPLPGYTAPFIVYQAPSDGGLVRVQVKVSADAEVRGLVKSTLEKELRTLPGVQVTDGRGDYTISVIVLKVVTRSRQDVGAALSVLVTEPIDARVRQFAELHVEPSLHDELGKLVSDAVQTRAHWIETTGSGEMPKVCRTIVQAFDSDVIKGRRRPSAGLRPISAATARPSRSR
jgi:hypothetical protein